MKFGYAKAYHPKEWKHKPESLKIWEEYYHSSEILSIPVHIQSLKSIIVWHKYRVVYKVEVARKRVLVYMVGIRREGSRRDVYALAEHLVHRGLI